VTPVTRPNSSAEQAEPASGAEPGARGGSETSSAELVIRAATASDDGAIELFVRDEPGAVFQRPGWRRAVQRVFRHQVRDLVALRGDQLVGLLPLMRCPRVTGGAHWISTPYGVYGGPLTSELEVRRALVASALQGAREERVGRLELRSREALDCEGLTPSDLYVTFVKDLPTEREDVLKSIRKDERRLIRRARDTHGLVLEEGRWFVEDLARLFRESKQRLGSPGLPVEWFRALLEELGEEVVIHIVRRPGEVLAASMCFIDGDELRMYYIGTTETANRSYAATSFMIAELQEWAVERGLKRFDLGRSRRDAGAVKFKRNQGFEAAPLHYSYGLVRSRGLPSFTPSNPRTARLRQIWAKLPATVCERLSRRLARYLP